MKVSPKLLQLCMVVSFVVATLIMIAMKPWTPDLGASWSPQRIALNYVCVIIGYTIPALISVYLFSQKPEWIAPPGRYIPEHKYKTFSTYTLTAAAIVAAVYAVSGLPTGVNIDLPALIAGFGAVYFGPVVMLIAFFFGFFVRWAIGGAPWLPVPVLAASVALLDASIWAINGYIFWSLIRGKLYEKASKTMRTILFIISIIIMIAVWNFGFIIWYAFIGNPLEAFLGYAAFAYSTWIPTGMAFIVLGALIGHSTYTARVTPGE